MENKIQYILLKLKFLEKRNDLNEEKITINYKLYISDIFE